MFQVLRWGALAFGVFYGFSHQAAITTKDKVAASKHEYERKEKLINEAKAAWAQKNAPKGQGNGCELLKLSGVKSGKTGTRICSVSWFETRTRMLWNMEGNLAVWHDAY